MICVYDAIIIFLYSNIIIFIHFNKKISFFKNRDFIFILNSFNDKFENKNDIFLYITNINFNAI